MLPIPKYQLQKFVGCFKMSTNNEPKESTYYTITLLGYVGHPEKPLLTDGHFSVPEAKRPETPME